MPWLAFGTAVRELPNAGEVVVGSGADATWRVSTADLMPRHFVVSVDGSSALVRSTTLDTVVVLNHPGVQLGMELQPLRDGDMILAGAGRFAFTLTPPSADAPLDTVEAMEAYLVDDERNILHPLVGRSTPIGRDASNAVVVRDPTASRFHAEIRREAGGFAVHSMGATGMILNGKPMLRPTMLAEGDVVEVAFLRLRFSREAPIGALAVEESVPGSSDEAGRRPTLASSPTVWDVAAMPRQRSRRTAWLVAIVLLAAVSAWWLVRKF